MLNPSLTASQLVRSILLDLGLEPTERDKLVQTVQLNRFLLDCLEKGENVTVIIDESQNLDTELMEQVSNLKTDQHKLMQIVLSGQPELRARLQQPELRQRVMVYCDLSPLSAVETAFYIRHRLQVATASKGVPVAFGSSAVEKIYERAQGIPRQINTLCDRALLAVYVREDRQISADDVNKAIRELSSLI